MAGITAGRGDWEYRLLTLTAASVITKGSAVGLAAARTVSEYSGGQAGLLGFILHNSGNSIPAGKGLIGIPKPGCTAFVDVPTGIAASSLSFGECYGLYQSGGITSFLTTGYTSAASRVVEVVGPIDTATSRIEVSFAVNSAQVYSFSTTSIQ